MRKQCLRHKERKEHTKTKTLLEKCDELIKVTISLILLDETLEFLGVNNQVQTTNLSKSELLFINTGGVNLLPDLDVICLAGTLNSSLVVLEMNQGGGKLGPVGDAGEEYLCSLVMSFSISLVTGFLNIS
jgi:hypothetical protein